MFHPVACCVFLLDLPECHPIHLLLLYLGPQTVDSGCIMIVLALCHLERSKDYLSIFINRCVIKIMKVPLDAITFIVVLILIEL